MSKKSKKRNKKYAGWDAGTDDSTVTIHRVAAVDRSPAGQWLHDHHKLVKRLGIALLVVAVVVCLFVFSFR